MKTINRGKDEFNKAVMNAYWSMDIDLRQFGDRPKDIESKYSGGFKAFVNDTYLEAFKDLVSYGFSIPEAATGVLNNDYFQWKGFGGYIEEFLAGRTNAINHFRGRS